MRKIKLNVDELEVASFDTEEQDTERGTIAGHDISGFTCPYCKTILTRDCCTPRM
jgi:hypothetical protein